MGFLVQRLNLGVSRDVRAGKDDGGTATDKNQSLWQLERDTTKASSGSRASADE